MNRPIVVVMMAVSLLCARGAVAGKPAAAPAAEKTTICHVPAEEPAGGSTLSIGSAAVRAHLTNHPGDHVGTCGANPCGNGLCEASRGETDGNCVEDCGCECQADVNASGLAVNLGTLLGVGTATLTANVCSDCTADGSTVALSFSPSIEIGTTAFTFAAGTVGAPQCSLVEDANGTLGTVVVGGVGEIAVGELRQATTFSLTLVEVAGLVCSAVLQLDSPSILGQLPSLTVPLSIPCGDAVLQACSES